MEITYIGHSAFKFRGKKATVVTDPFDPKTTGLKFAKVEADVVTVSHQHNDHNATHMIGASPFIIDGPGEYEVKGVGIIGLSTYHDDDKGSARGSNTVFAIEIDGIHIVHLGDLGHALTVKEIEQLGTVDILLTPVGGEFTINEKQAVDLVHEIEPSIVIPMHYGRPELPEAVFGKLSPVSSFLKLIGSESTVPQPKLSLTKDKLPEQMQVIVLE